LTLIVLGTGLLKPNISVMVGELYAPDDARRDAAFSVFYMGINLGGFLGPLVTGYLAQQEGFRAMVVGWGMDPNATWHFAFGAAGIGMTLGVIQYVLGAKKLGEAGKAPGSATTPELATKYRQQAWRWGGLGVGLLVVAAIAAVTGALPLSAASVRDWAGYSLLVITVLFFGSLFIDKSWTAAERARLVAGGRHHAAARAAADEDRLPAQRRVVELLHRREECVEVRVQDGARRGHAATPYRHGGTLGAWFPHSSLPMPSRLRSSPSVACIRW
jgi:MFS family permease